MARQRGGGSSAKSGGLFAKKAAPAPAAPARSGGLFGSKQAPPPPQRTVHQAPPPAVASHAPAPAAPSAGGGMMSGLGGMVVQGMAMGTGSAIAHHAVNGVVNSFSGSGKEESHQPQPQASYQSSAPVQSKASSGPCMLNEKELYQCLNDQNGSAGQCQYYFDALKQCQDSQAF